MSDVQRSDFATHVLMIRPTGFRRDPEAALSNSFMELIDAGDEAINLAAQAEFDALVASLESAGVRVWVVEDSLGLPDSVFPNNWFSWHHGAVDPGKITVVTYPMCAEARRRERTLVDFEAIAAERGLEIARQFHLDSYEQQSRYLEGTGSLVLEHATRTAFAASSVRTDPGLVRSWSETMRYTPLVFDSVDSAGDPVYHTNVVLAVGHGFALLGSHTIPNEAERRDVEDALRGAGLDVIELSASQISDFAGNALQLRAVSGEYVLAMSSRARGSLTADQVARIERHSTIVHVPIPMIEAVGGGSVRCMIGEIGYDPREG